ncbi:MAG: nucleotide sugar dehydrogenase [Proteobacteria bacterium]|nr:nucleotide sugar dehydrogenase [Pseudomonadota bacterium]
MTLKIAVIGLGYVGLPLAEALSRRFPVTGFDEDAARVEEIKSGHDRTGEVEESALLGSALERTSEAGGLGGADVFIIAVPTPVDGDNRPDLSALRAAAATVGRAMKKGALVVLESTVYPGVTENILGPELEAASGLACGRDFFLGYAPERTNPGDREHTLERITKVVAGQTTEVTATLTEIYGAVTSGGVFVAKDIKTAEAAKVIENAQRDINIAFVNEVTKIFREVDISILDVLEAASTKWNFLGFSPGLVGGHCIGVDPFYLAHCAQEAGYEPEIILAGRRINDGMGTYVAQCIDQALAETAPRGKETRILVLGLTFKENVPDLRNSKVFDIIEHLEGLGYTVDAHDPLADADEAARVHGVHPLASLDGASGYDCVIGAVAHGAYRDLGPDALAGLFKPGGLLADVKGMWRGKALPDGVSHWRL